MFDIKKDTVCIPVPEPQFEFARHLTELSGYVELARQQFLKAGFNNVELAKIPQVFFFRAHSDPDQFSETLYDYTLVLRATISSAVTLTELQKHAAMINVYHDIYKHVIPTDTVVKFSPTLAMTVVEWYDKNGM